MSVTLRPVAESDGPALTHLVVANRDSTATWDAVRGEEHFTEHALHRPQAATLPHDVRSQRVLAHNGFTRVGTAERYVRIARRSQDRLLIQRLAEESE